MGTAFAPKHFRLVSIFKVDRMRFTRLNRRRATMGVNMVVGEEGFPGAYLRENSGVGRVPR